MSTFPGDTPPEPLVTPPAEPPEPVHLVVEEYETTEPAPEWYDDDINVGDETNMDTA